MKATRIRLSFLAISVLFLGTVARTEIVDPLPDLVERVQPSVANISSTTVITYTQYGWDDFLQFWGVPRERKHSSLGSGFVVDQSGYVLTNSHVVENASEVLVTLADKRKFRARIVGLDPKMDIGLLQMLDDKGNVPTGLKPVKFGNSEKVRIGESVVAIGNPFGLQNTVTRGIISAKNRTIGLGPFDDFLQTDASINPGNSGGPLFDLKGDVIGINTVIYSRTGQSGGLGFAIPINEAAAVLGDLKKFGRVPRPWLGILTEKITPQIQQYYGLPRADGVLVYDLVQKAPASRSGLRQGDIIVEVNGKPTREPDELERALARFKPTEKVKIKAQRKNQVRTFTVQLRELPRKLNKLPQGVI